MNKQKTSKVLSIFIISILALSLANLGYSGVKAQTTTTYYMGIVGSSYVISTSQSLISPIVASSSSSYVFNYTFGPSGVASSGNSLTVEAGSYFVDQPWLIDIYGATFNFQTGSTLTAGITYNGSENYLLFNIF